MNREIKAKIQKLANSDYQGRNKTGAFPRSGIPDAIRVYQTDDKKGLEVFALFKDTSETEARQWLARKIHRTVAPGKPSTGLKITYDTWQEGGDYQDDWVTAKATIR